MRLASYGKKDSRYYVSQFAVGYLLYANESNLNNTVEENVSPKNIVVYENDGNRTAFHPIGNFKILDEYFNIELEDRRIILNAT